MKKTKWFLVGILASLCACFGVFALSACKKTEEQEPKSEHEHVYIEEIIVSTCTNQGYTNHVCSCGDNYKSDYQKTLGHDFGEFSIDNSDRYDCDASKTATCKRENCGEKNTVVEKGVNSQGVRFTLWTNSSCYYVTGYTDDVKENIVIPSSFNGVPVVAIQGGAFSNCEKLKSIKIPNSITEINVRAFAGCTNLTSITIPESVIEIGENVFNGCTSLTISCETENQPEKWVLLWNAIKCKSGEKVVCAPVVWDCDVGVADDGYIYKIINNVRYALKDGQATVVKQASNTISANIPASITYKNSIYKITSIAENAFKDCLALSEVSIGENIKTIGVSAFENCTSLVNVVIPESVTSIGVCAFAGCAKLMSINVSTNNQYYQSIDGNLYSKGGAIFYQYASGKTNTSFELSQTVGFIDHYAFYKTVNLQYVILSNELVGIGSYVFQGCENLRSIYIPVSVTEIGSYAFYNCTNLMIYCEVDSEPSDWYPYWNASDCPVLWGYTE